MAWSPTRLLKEQQEYVRWTVTSAFLLCMLVLVSVFVDDYRMAEQVADLPPKAATAPPPPPPANSMPSEPIGGGQKESPVQQPSKIEIDIFGIKMAMSNEASWAAIAKIIVTILSTFFGLRLINYIFKRLEEQPSTA